jgi:hypothetical protein
MVPTLTVQQILNAIPAHLYIPYIKTDMQGHDFAAIAAAGHMLFKEGVDYILTEVFFHDETSYEEFRMIFVVIGGRICNE